MQDAISSLIGAIAKGPAPRLARTRVNGLIVSTVDSCDCGWETAIIDANSAYPVERYETEEKAIEGHKKWCECAKDIETITQLGYMDVIDDEVKTLVRASDDMLDSFDS